MATSKDILIPDIDILPASALLRLPAVVALVQCSRSSWFSWVRAGHAPSPIRIGPRAVAWRASDIRTFLAGSERGPAPAYTIEGGKLGRAKQIAMKAEKQAELI